MTLLWVSPTIFVDLAVDSRWELSHPVTNSGESQRLSDSSFETGAETHKL